MNFAAPRPPSRAVLFVFACCLGACAAVSTLGPGGNRDIASFRDVRFGRPLPQTELLYPLGDPETSPYGADAYTLRNVEVDGAKYESVVFEFTHDHGMQMVFARFATGSGDAILEQLRKNLGSPVESVAGDLPDQREVTWKTASGVKISFDGPGRHLILIGPYGDSLEPDVNLRRQMEP